MQYIEKSTLQFLRDIKENNNRPWFQENKDRYEEALKNVKDFVQEVRLGLERSDHIEGAKTFRIYRDVRFSKDKSPYKSNFGTALKRATAALRGGYYLHLEPGNTMVAGGFWGPNSSDLKRIRQEFERDDSEIRKILADSLFKKYFGQLRGDEVKTAPKGFNKDHPAIDLIWKKSFVAKRTFNDKEVLDPLFAEEVVKSFETMRPYFDYMSDVLTTNLDGESLL